MEIHALKVNTRKASGKTGAVKVRATGQVPAVLYGGSQDPVSLELNLREFETLLHRGHGGSHAIVQLEVQGSPELNSPALLKDVQRHPLRGQVIHADFMRISLDKRITTMVAIRVEGHAVGIVEGGSLDQQMREVEVECLALDVPEEIVIDVTNLHMGHTIHLSEVTPPVNVTFITDLDRPVVAVHAPRVAKETAEGAEGESTQPEVIGEKKDKE